MSSDDEDSENTHLDTEKEVNVVKRKEIEKKYVLISYFYIAYMFITRYTPHPQHYLVSFKLQYLCTSYFFSNTCVITSSNLRFKHLIGL